MSGPTFAVAGYVVAWANRYLAGELTPAELADRLAAQRVLHVVHWPAHPKITGWPDLLGDLLTDAVADVRLEVPAAGDPGGLRADPGGLAAAVAAGAAVVTGRSLMVLPSLRREHVEWMVREGGVADVPTPRSTVRQSSRDLTSVVRESAAELEVLDVARASPALRDALTSTMSACALPRLRGALDGSALDLIDSAARLLTAVEVARRDEGGAVSASEAARRRDALAPVLRAARAALATAYSSGAAGP